MKIFEKVASFNQSRNYLTLSYYALCLHKLRLTSKIEHCCSILAGEGQSSLSRLIKVQNRFLDFVANFPFCLPFPHRRKVASLSLFRRYFHSKCSVELHSLVPQILTFTGRTCCILSMKSNHPHLLRVTNA